MTSATIGIGGPYPKRVQNTKRSKPKLNSSATCLRVSTANNSERCSLLSSSAILTPTTINSVKAHFLNGQETISGHGGMIASEYAFCSMHSEAKAWATSRLLRLSDLRVSVNTLSRSTTNNAAQRQ